jgi:hypothetical protein
MATIELLPPAGVIVGNAVPVAKGIPTLEDRVVGLLDNSSRALELPGRVAAK